MLPKSTNIHRKAPRDGRARRPCRVRQADPHRPGRDTPEPPDEGAICAIHPIPETRTDGHTPIERECIRIQQERIAVWRSGALGPKVVERPRRSTENGWSYDRAA